MSEYPVGAVCVATVRGVKDVRVMRTICQGWRSGQSVEGYAWHHDTHLTDIRPLVVLDVGAMAPSFVAALRAERNTAALAIADQIEAQTKPRIAEPTGLGAVVKDASGGLWVLTDTTPHALGWRRDRGDWAAWREIGGVEVLSEGVAQ